MGNHHSRRPSCGPGTPDRRDYKRPALSHGCAEQAQSTDAAVGRHVEPDVCNRPKSGQLRGVEVLTIYFHFLLRQQVSPEQALGFDLAVGTAFDVSALNRDAVWIVAFVVKRVDHDALDFPGDAQRDYYPVITGRAAAGSFPALGHHGGATGVKDVAHLSAVACSPNKVANELKDRKIRANVLSPGFTRTPLMDNGLKMSESDIATLRQHVEQITPLGYMAQPEEVASAALFPASDDARYVNGVELMVDGGLSQI